MQTSLLLKIGITGLFLSVMAAVLPLIFALLGNDSLSNWVSDNLNLKVVTIALFSFAGLMVYAMAKKGRQKYLDEMHRNYRP